MSSGWQGRPGWSGGARATSRDHLAIGLPAGADGIYDEGDARSYERQRCEKRADTRDVLIGSAVEHVRGNTGQNPQNGDREGADYYLFDPAAILHGSASVVRSEFSPDCADE